MQRNMYIENFLKTTDIEKLSFARTRIIPLIDGARSTDTLWLCALCYELGRRECNESEKEVE